MSVIGPRPALWNQDVLIAEREKYHANDVKPGLTGWAQINGRDELEIPVKAKLMFILFSVRTTIFPMTWSQDPSGGMGIITFIMIYIMASWIRKYYQIKNHVKIWGGIYILCVLTLVLSKVIMIEMK